MAPRKKRAPVAPEDVMEDTIGPDIEPEDLPFEEPAPAPKAKRTRKAGPKKVLGETAKLIGDAVTEGVRFLGQHPNDPRKSLSTPEAESIGHPIVRILARRIPNFLKPALGKLKLDPEDAADLEEIAATIAKVAIRHLKIGVADFINRREDAMSKVVDSRPAPAQHTPEPPVARTASLNELRESREVVAVAPHNPAFDILNNVDLGLEAA